MKDFFPLVEPSSQSHLYMARSRTELSGWGKASGRPTPVPTTELTAPAPPTPGTPAGQQGPPTPAGLSFPDLSVQEAETTQSALSTQGRSPALQGTGEAGSARWRLPALPEGIQGAALSSMHCVCMPCSPHCLGLGSQRCPELRVPRPCAVIPTPPWSAAPDGHSPYGQTRCVSTGDARFLTACGIHPAPPTMCV